MSTPTATAGRRIAFGTSGHTGRPVMWTRTADQIRAEVDLIADELIGDVDEVVSFAPPSHLFGALFGEALPRLRNLPVQHLHDDPLGVPTLRPDIGVLFVCLPASWVVLRRLVPEIAALPRAVLLHGAGPTTPVVDEVMASLRGAPARAVELFGSTETGGVGFRKLGPAAAGTAWTLLPDVELVLDRAQDGLGPDTQFLHVRSPRLAHRPDTGSLPDSIRLQDVIRVLDRRRFEFLGRASRLIKVNGRRCDLDQVERAAGDLLEADVACIAVRDGVRGEHYELFHAGGPPRSTDDIWRRLGALGPTTPVPRRVHSVPAIPLSATGKIKIDQLYASANADAGGGRR